MTKVNVDLAELAQCGKELAEIMDVLSHTAKVVDEEYVQPIVVNSGSEKLIEVGNDLKAVAEDCKKQLVNAEATNEGIQKYVNELAQAMSNS
ncbi:MAG: hypothetical protein ABS904_00130 [Solibacillus isronensis]